MRDLWITLGIFPILFGIPLLIIQVVSWLIKFLKKEKISCPFFLNKQIIRLILILSAIIGFASSLMVSKSEYETQKFVNFISGKSFHLKEGAIVGVFVFIIALLPFFSATVTSSSRVN